MKNIKTFEQFISESSQQILPKEALDALKDYVDLSKAENSIEVHQDPQVSGTYAIRVHRGEQTFDLLWNRGDMDEVEFEEWPPVSDKLKFWI